MVLAALAGAVPVVLPAHPKLVDGAEQLGLPCELVVTELRVDAIAKAIRAALAFDARKLRPLIDDLRDSLAFDAALLGNDRTSW
jgi:hypothetical protein